MCSWNWKWINKYDFQEVNWKRYKHDGSIIFLELRGRAKHQKQTPKHSHRNTRDPREPPRGERFTTNIYIYIYIYVYNHLCGRDLNLSKTNHVWYIGVASVLQPLLFTMNVYNSPICLARNFSGPPICHLFCFWPRICLARYTFCSPIMLLVPYLFDDREKPNI